MSTSKFKVGDKVVRVKRDFQNLKIGHVGIVSQVGSFSIRLDNDPTKSFLGEDYFELYEEPKKKFSGKFRIENEKHSRKVQEYLFSIGCKWMSKVFDKEQSIRNTGSGIIYVSDNIIFHGFTEGLFLIKEEDEYTLKETTTYSIEAVPALVPKIETIEILGKHYSKEDVEKAFSELQEIVK